MPVRTSTAVTLGLILLTVLGIGAIFGNTILAVVAPAAPAAATPPAPAAAGAPATGSSGLPSAGSATAAPPAAPQNAKDGSS